eukprot:594021-Amphidinium_carterae.1
MCRALGLASGEDFVAAKETSWRVLKDSEFEPWTGLLFVSPWMGHLQSQGPRHCPSLAREEFDSLPTFGRLSSRSRCVCASSPLRRAGSRVAEGAANSLDWV